MRYAVLYTRRAARDIAGLDAVVRKRIGNAIFRFVDEPLDHAERLTSRRLGQYRFRIGDYRVIFDLHGTTVVILRVGHRREIYR